MNEATLVTLHWWNLLFSIHVYLVTTMPCFGQPNASLETDNHLAVQANLGWFWGGKQRQLRWCNGFVAASCMSLATLKYQFRSFKVDAYQHRGACYSSAHIVTMWACINFVDCSGKFSVSVFFASIVRSTVDLYFYKSNHRVCSDVGRVLKPMATPCPV